MPPGGQHPRMGTHNLLISLGPASFLEVIVNDPDASTPAEPRWDDLEDLRAAQEFDLDCWHEVNSAGGSST